MRVQKIIVVGSSNMDMIVKTHHIPAPGETVLSGSFFMSPGGKGANQAVAIARLGGDVIFISKLGNDIFGTQFTQLFNEEGIDTSYLIADEDNPSGVALITVDRKGENSIVVASGANANLSIADIEPALNEIAAADILLVQLEIPMETVNHVVEYAASKGKKIILNPAPANTLSAELLRKIDILTPNMTEAGILANMNVTNLASAKKAALAICQQGVKNVIVTMGSLGALLCQKGECSLFPGKQVVTIDTTGAGDVFNGALAVAIAEGKDLETAVIFANEIAAISVTRLGAQSAIPKRSEILIKN